jgi:hypothetical protein
LLAPAPRLGLDIPGRGNVRAFVRLEPRIRGAVALPDGRKLVVLRDAANYITALPAKDVALPEWQAAIEALILVVELGGPTMFARIGVMRALNHGHVREFNPSRKEHHWGRRKLKRDQ